MRVRGLKIGFFDVLMLIFYSIDIGRNIMRLIDSVVCYLLHVRSNLSF